MIVPTPDNTPRGPHAMVGKTLQGRRMQAGITLRRMAAALDMTMTAYSRVEQGWEELTAERRGWFDAVVAAKGQQDDDPDR
jgi:hypothetical protein